ncbi:MAG: divergent polysaccharide deacetylase family protein [Pseudomonadota bacterium]
MAGGPDPKQQPPGRPGLGASSRSGMRLALLGAGAGAAVMATAVFNPELLGDGPLSETTGTPPPAEEELALAAGAAAAEPAWRRFAVPDRAGDARVQTADARPLIALVIAPYEGSLGAAEAIDAPITLVLPAGGEAAHAARARGHEVLLDLASAGRAGDAARDAAAAAGARVQTGLPAAENARRLDERFAGGDGYVGVAVIGDAEAAADPQLLRTVFKNAEAHGLLVFDGRASNKGGGYLLRRASAGPSAAAEIVVDAERTPEAMAEALASAERLAEAQGSCVAFARAHPETLRALSAWLSDRDAAKARLAPLTAVVEASLAER